jgi:hypothetical protein
MPAQEKPALYDRLGGVYNIATVVDDFIDRIIKKGGPGMRASKFTEQQIVAALRLKSLLSER